MTQRLVSTLNLLGHETRLVDRRFSKTLGDMGRFHIRKVCAALWMPVRLGATGLRFRPDVVVFFSTTREYTFLVDVVLKWVLSAQRASVVFYLHTVGYRRIALRGSVWAALVASLLRGRSHVVTLGPSLDQDVAPWVAAPRITHIPNAVVTSTADAPPQPSPARLLYFSNRLPEKGAADFIEVALAVANKLPELEFVLAGAPVDSTFERRLVQRIADGEMAHRVRFVDTVKSDAERSDLFSGALALVFPSESPFEAQPLAILEAFAAGVPVIAYDIGGIRDLLGDGKAGCLVDPGDIRQVIGHVLALAADPSKRTAMARNARAAAVKNHTLTRYAEHWAELLRLVTEDE